MSHAKLAMLLMGVGVCFGAFFVILKATGSSNLMFDGLTFTLGLAGMTLLTLRYVEQWYFNMAANFSAVVLWIVKTSESAENLNFLIICAVAVVVNLMGLLSWRKIYQAVAQTEDKPGYG